MNIIDRTPSTQKSKDDLLFRLKKKKANRLRVKRSHEREIQKIDLDIDTLDERIKELKAD